MHDELVRVPATGQGQDLNALPDEREPDEKRRHILSRNDPDYGEGFAKDKPGLVRRVFE